MREKITHSQAIYDGRVVKLSVHQVRLPDGNVSQREVIHHTGAVAVVALDEQQNIVLVRQYRIAADKIMLEIPAGILNIGEDPLLCAERELQEETGYRPIHIRPIGGIYPAPGYTAEYIHLFLVTGMVESRLKGDDDEFLEIVRMPLNDALKMVEDGEMTDAKSVVSILKVARLLRL